MGQIEIPIDSLLFTGALMLLFNVFFFNQLKFLCQAVCAYTNVHYVYGCLQPVSPRISRLSAFFGGPIGHLPLSRAFSILIAMYAVVVVFLDFSINGGSSEKLVDTTYMSVVQSHPEYKPLDIDYENEANITLSGHGRTGSTRLVAISEMHACMRLNFSHHRIFAYAFLDTNLDKELVPLDEELKNAECITEENFEEDNVMHSWPLTIDRWTPCDMGSARIYVDESGPSVIKTANISFEDKSGCEDIDFRVTRCFLRMGDYHCVSIGTNWEFGHEGGEKERADYAIFFADSGNAAASNREDLRHMTGMSEEELIKLASNMAFFTGVGFPHGEFNTLFMATAMVTHDVVLKRRVTFNTSNVDSAMLVPVLTIIVTILLGMAITARCTWAKFVRDANRRNLNSFCSVGEVLEMVQDGCLSKERSEKPQTRYIFLQHGRPVIGVEPRDNPSV